ncbi:MAG: GAF domain-containing protein [Chloroflexi bacterium]|nr:GAF domain-containing protein [Chloroflexota bacterium]MCY4247350.1 GAF domain-containing protein [Chloroflexota bacterium]
MNDTSNGAASLLGDLRQLDDLIKQVEAALSVQRDQLRNHRLAMPSAVLTSFSHLQADFKRLELDVLAEQTELRQLRALGEMAVRMTNSLDADTVLAETMELVILLTQAERGYIILTREDSDQYDFRISSESGLLGLSTPDGSPPQISMSVVNQVISSGEPLLADNAYQDERWSDSQSIANFTLRSVLCVPLRFKDQSIGAVYVDNRLMAGIFTERELTLLMAFANVAAVAINNARMYSRAEQILAEITRVKELMDNIFSSVGSAIIAIDSNDLVHTFNRAAGDILNLPPASVLGRQLQGVLQEAALQLSEELRLVKEEDDDHTLNMLAELPGRGPVALSMSFSPLKDRSQMTQGVTLVMDDVTHLREHETTINAMKRILPEGMVDQISEIANIEMGGMRREVSCLFADVRPWTTLPDVAPSETLRILNQYQAVATSCIHDAGGIIDKYMGSEVMALFNTQLNPDEQHARQAVECGLLMRDRFLQLYSELGIAPEPHFYIVGIASGVATLGNIGSFRRREFTALGHTINTAKRMQENARRGSVTIGQPTLDLILLQKRQPPFEFIARAPIYGKGLSTGMNAYEVQRSA